MSRAHSPSSTAACRGWRRCVAAGPRVVPATGGNLKRRRAPFLRGASRWKVFMRRPTRRPATRRPCLRVPMPCWIVRARLPPLKRLRRQRRQPSPTRRQPLPLPVLGLQLLLRPPRRRRKPQRCHRQPRRPPPGRKIPPLRLPLLLRSGLNLPQRQSLMQPLLQRRLRHRLQSRTLLQLRPPAG